MRAELLLRSAGSSASFGVFILKALETAFGVHHLVGAGIEGVAVRADVHLQVSDGHADFEHVSTVAGGFGVEELRVNAFFHNMPRLVQEPEKLVCALPCFRSWVKTENCSGIEGFSMVALAKSRIPSPRSYLMHLLHLSGSLEFGILVEIIKDFDGLADKLW